MDNEFLLYGTALARQQDRIFASFESDVSEISRLTKKKFELADSLEKNMWVHASSKLAPSNLVIRHFCLIDILRNKTDYYGKIIRQFNYISRFSENEGLWLEGYSYWRYVKPFLMMYAMRGVCINVYENRIMSNHLINLIGMVDKGFQKTAYLRDGALYPAPFGDLRDEPLEQRLQDVDMIVSEIEVGPVRKVNGWYTIKGALLGFNSHTPNSNESIIISDGRPSNFEFYTGFDDKYKSTTHEIIDLLRPSKIRSAFKNIFRRRG